MHMLEVDAKFKEKIITKNHLKEKLIYHSLN
jgi:hypothetical protein